MRLRDYLIFAILLLNFTAVEIKKLRLLHMTGMNVALLLFQILVSLGGYIIAKAIGGDEIVAEGVLIAVLCPVAASSVVISCLWCPELQGEGEEEWECYYRAHSF